MSANHALETRWFTTRPLSPVLGALVPDVDLAAPIGADLFDAINAAFLHHKVIVFPGQTVDADQHVRFSALFGELQVHVLNQYHSTGRPEVLTISNLDADGRPRGEHPDPGACIWHTDGSWQRHPVLATSLHALSIPPAGGDTLFADLIASYEALDEDEQARLRSLVAVHDLDASRRRSGARDQMTEAQRRAAPPVEHAVVRPHPESGRMGFYLGEHASHIRDLPLAEGRALVERLNAHITSPPFVYRHRWEPGQLVVWDNRAVLHKATEFDTARHARVLRRTTSLGETARGVPAV